MSNPKKFYIGWYLRPPIWASSEPDWDKIRDLKTSVRTLVSELVFESLDHGIRIERDGLILIDVEYLTHLFTSKSKTKAGDEFTTANSFTSFCLDYANSISLLLQSEFVKEQKLFIFKTEKILDAFVLSDFQREGLLLEDGRIGYDSLELIRSEFQKRDLQLPADCFDEVKKGDFRQLNQWVDQLIYFRFDKHNRQILTESIFKNLLLQLQPIQKDLSYFPLLSLLVSVIEKYQKQLFFESLINAWSIIEFFINKDWDTLVSELKSQGRMNKNRKKALSGRDYTASIKTNILEIQKIIPQEIFEKMNLVRSARNDIVHKFSYALYDNNIGDSKRIAEICAASFDVIRYFISKYASIDLLINSSISSTVLKPSGTTAKAISNGKNTIQIETPD